MAPRWAAIWYKERRSPRLSDLRDSGSVEMFARKVLLLLGPISTTRRGPPHHYQVEVAKSAGTGVVPLRWGAAPGNFWAAAPARAAA